LATRPNRSSARQAHGEIIAQPEDRVVPSRGHRREGQIGKFWVLRSQEPTCQIGIDFNLGRWAGP
jgi:hypothetical protein